MDLRCNEPGRPAHEHNIPLTQSLHLLLCDGSIPFSLSNSLTRRSDQATGCDAPFEKGGSMNWFYVQDTVCNKLLKIMLQPVKNMLLQYKLSPVLPPTNYLTVFATNSLCCMLPALFFTDNAVRFSHLGCSMSIYRPFR